jgi:hypothetical protein
MREDGRFGSVCARKMLVAPYGWIPIQRMSQEVIEYDSYKIDVRYKGCMYSLVKHVRMTFSQCAGAMCKK